TLISAAVKYYHARQQSRYAALIAHTYRIIRVSNELGSLLTDAENYHRGYLINKDSIDLQGYRNALPVVGAKYDSLVTMTADNAASSTLLRQNIKPQISSFIAMMNEVVDNSNTASALLLNDTINQAMRHVRASLHDLIALEDKLLVQRTTQLKSTHVINDIIHYSSFAMICLISGMALKTLLDKEKNNKELLNSLHDANKNLEANVQERTAELEKKSLLAEKLNRDLQDNFKELQSFYESLHVSNAKAEDTIKEMRDLYENAPAGHHSLNADGIIVRMNQTELNWLGYTRDEVVGKMHVSRIIVPDEHASYHDSFSLFQKQGYVRNKQHTFVRKDGSTFKVLLNATAIYDSEGKYVMSRGVTYLSTE
ncbi:MAG TPA: CHASE3 domain-containing protein, partial [Chryseolinea sp.]|nr:CHASE3 domain-containing protein [Chryseolinea sp.]